SRGDWAESGAVMTQSAKKERRIRVIISLRFATLRRSVTRATLLRSVANPSRLLFGAANTRHAATARTAGSVFRSHRLFQFYAGGVREGRQPGEHVGELGSGDLGVFAATEGGGQLADLLHEPHEGPVDAAAAVLGAERVADQALELRKGHEWITYHPTS